MKAKSTMKVRMKKEMTAMDEGSAVTSGVGSLSYEERTRRKDRRLACIKQAVIIKISHNAITDSNSGDIVTYARELYEYVENG